MEILASAPGKVVLLGEYAVLDGAPALSMAIDRRARVRLLPRAGRDCEVLAPEILSVPVPLGWSENGEPRWPDEALAAKLALVDQVLRGLLDEKLLSGEGFDLHIDTAEFFEGAGGERLKLGLGSSAALTVALASALAAFAGHAATTAESQVWLQRLLRLHRRFQNGHGSGVDVATSLIGGFIVYRLECGAAQARAALWPAALHYRFVWSGRSASTPQLLAQLQRWREGHAADYAAHLRALTDIAAAAVAALDHPSAGRLLDAAAAYANALRAFGEASGLDIFSAEHLRLTALARAAGVTYKSCGAGGGDVGVAFAIDPQRLDHFESACARAGFLRVPMRVDESGLRLEF